MHTPNKNKEAAILNMPLTRLTEADWDTVNPPMRKTSSLSQKQSGLHHRIYS
jgi:hypothetical protein